jgi:hypothetical protein
MARNRRILHMPMEWMNKYDKICRNTHIKWTTSQCSISIVISKATKTTWVRHKTHEIKKIKWQHLLQFGLFLEKKIINRVLCTITNIAITHLILAHNSSLYL